MIPTSRFSDVNSFLYSTLCGENERESTQNVFDDSQLGRCLLIFTPSTVYLIGSGNNSQSWQRCHSQSTSTINQRRSRFLLQREKNSRRIKGRQERAIRQFKHTSKSHQRYRRIIRDKSTGFRRRETGNGSYRKENRNRFSSALCSQNNSKRHKNVSKQKTLNRPSLS